MALREVTGRGCVATGGGREGCERPGVCWQLRHTHSSGAHLTALCASAAAEALPLLPPLLVLLPAFCPPQRAEDLHPRFRTTLPERLEPVAAAYRLGEIRVKSFQLQDGMKRCVKAIDLVHAVTALLECGSKKGPVSTFGDHVDKFWWVGWGLGAHPHRRRSVGVACTAHLMMVPLASCHLSPRHLLQCSIFLVDLGAVQGVCRTHFMLLLPPPPWVPQAVLPRAELGRRPGGAPPGAGAGQARAAGAGPGRRQRADAEAVPQLQALPCL